MIETTEQSELVSIVLPTYNGSKYIQQSVDSCLNQTYKNIELIIVDDGSTDETAEIIKLNNDKRIKYIKHEINKGLPIALNSGFDKSSGQLLTWTSDDNLYSPNAIEEMVIFLKQIKGSFVYCDYFTFNDAGNIKNLIELPNTTKLEDGNHVGACFLYTRRVMEIIGAYDPSTKLAEDYDYWIRITKEFPIFHLNKSLYYYRIHKNSLTSSRYNEIRIIELLVRFKNNILPINKVTGLFISLIIEKENKHKKLKKIIAKIRFSRKIKTTLIDYEMGKINLSKTKLALSNIIDMSSFLILVKL
jgi:glycosyltransferase involved in cell wall biosynthesis